MRQLDERLNRIDNHFLAYHRTSSQNIERIAENGFQAGYGSMYGKGWYFTYDLSSQTRGGMTHYGDGLIKAKINPKNLLMFDYNVSKDLFGDKYTLQDQLITHYRIYRGITDMPRELFLMSKDLEQTFSSPTYSADVAYNQFVKSFINQSTGESKIKGVYGIIFTGNHDGNVLVSYSYDTAIPFEYALTDTSTGDMITEWLPIKNIDKVVSRANLAEIALEKFRGMVKRIEVDNYDISNIEKDFPWLFQAKMRDAIIKINDDKSLEWISGDWLKGHWKGDWFMSGNFLSGVWERGEFMPQAEWHFGNFNSGTFSGRIWNDGIWNVEKSVWNTSDSVWRTGKLAIDNRKVQTNSSPLSLTDGIDIASILQKFGKRSIQESFDLRSLSDQERDDLYANFEKAYLKAVGSAWSRDQFDSRAYDWTFFGSVDGGIALRKQRSGMWKMNATFGSPKKVIDAFQEMRSEIGNEPIWGVMTENLAVMLEKLSGKEFKQPPKLFAKTVIPHIKHIFGAEIKDVLPNGDIIVATPAGDMAKRFIANKKYFRDLMDMAKNNPDKVPVPKPVLNTLIGMLKLFI